MRYFSYPDDTTSYDCMVLIKDSYFYKDNIKKHYADAITGNIIACDLPFPNNKQTINGAKQYLQKLSEHIIKLGIKYIYCTDATYFKALTGLKKAEPYIGYVKPCKITAINHVHIVMGVNYGQLSYNPNLYSKLDLSLHALNSHIVGEYKELGDVIEQAYYPSQDDIEHTLSQLKQYPVLTCDIETTGLALGSKLFSIGFGISKTKGVAFKVENTKPLKALFESYHGTLIFHNATFDIKHLIYNVFMKHETDYHGQLHGLHTLYRHIHDTKIIAYLATNSTAGNELGLKELSHEYVGNYAIDIKDVTKHPVQTVLEYNLIDCLATYYAYEKYYPLMLKDNQKHIYETLMLPTLKTITQMEMTGLPIDMDRVLEVERQLSDLQNTANNKLQQLAIGLGITDKIRQQKLDRLNSKLKKKQHGISHLKDYHFNPNSYQHLQYAIYEHLGLPVLDYTDSRQPAVSADSLEKLIHHTDDESIQNFIKAINEYSAVNKILTAFIPAFKQAKKRGNRYFLHGNLNLGGTLSGRLSSSNPNLQQLPSGSEFGSLIKSCFISDKEWLFVGADFASLEDRINALLTKDENKLKVYIDGYDGHSLRAFYYWRDKMPDIVETVESINSIADKYKKYRQLSKAPTFALTYAGTYQTLMQNCGFSEQEAKQIEANYHNLYRQSDEWTASKLKLCEKQGYIDVAFGLRIRTPIIANTILKTSKTPYMAEAEARSVGNAISGQSYGLLTNRALNAVMEQVWQSEYRYDIYPVVTIHDAIYFIVKNDVSVVKYINDLLIEQMKWQDLPEIQHDIVKLEAELDIYYPNWSNAITLPNNQTEEQIIELVKQSIS